MQLKYEHTQKGGIWFYFILMLFAIGIPGLFISGEHENMPPWVLLLVIFLYIYLAAFMIALSVKIDDQFIRVAFGWFAFRKRFLLSEIVDCRVVRNSWFWGWGIRWYFHGWLYNIDGLNAVEIIFKSGKKARIGTDEPEKLAQAIREAIA